jgi:hypothetical protein
MNSLFNGYIEWQGDITPPDRFSDRRPPQQNTGYALFVCVMAICSSAPDSKSTKAIVGENAPTPISTSTSSGRAHQHARLSAVGHPPVPNMNLEQA